MSLQEWLLKHQDKFVTYTTDEIASLAIACGFTRQEVAQYLSDIHFQKRSFDE